VLDDLNVKLGCTIKYSISSHNKNKINLQHWQKIDMLMINVKSLLHLSQAESYKRCLGPVQELEQHRCAQGFSPAPARGRRTAPGYNRLLFLDISEIETEWNIIFF